MTRVNLNLNETLLQKIDEYAKTNGLNRTSAISVLCGQQLQFQEGIKAMSLMTAQLEMEKAIK